MSDAEVAAEVEEVTRQRDALVAQLAPRKRAEAATLKQLNERISAARREIARFEAQLGHNAEAMIAAAKEREKYEQTMRGFALGWLRIGEPLLLALLMLFTFLTLASSLYEKTVGMTLLAAFAIGGGLRWWLRGPHG